MSKINWKIVLRCTEYDDEGNPTRIHEGSQVATDEMLVGSVLDPESILHHMISELYRQVKLTEDDG